MSPPERVDRIEEQLAAATSPGLVRRAQKELAGGAVTAAVTREGDTIRLEWSDGVVCHFPGNAALRGVRCSCAAVEVCRHVVRGVLYLRESGLIAGQEEMLEAESQTPVAPRGERPKSKPPAAKIELEKGEAIGRVRRLLAEIFRGGLDGLSLGWMQSARGAVADLRQGGLRRLAGLLADLADLIGSGSPDEPPAEPSRASWLLAALWLEVLTSAAQAPSPWDDERAAGGPKPLCLFGLACAGWKTDEIVGITLSLLERETGTILTIGTGRPIDGGDSFGNLAARVPLLGGHTARDLLGRWVECSAARWADHRLSLEEGAVASLSPERVDWDGLGDRFGVRRFAAVRAAFARRFPSLAWRNMLEVSLFRPDSWGEVDYSTSRGRLRWPMRDAEGEEITLMLWRKDEERRAAIAALVAQARRAAPRWVIGRASIQAGRVIVRPLALVSGEGAQGVAYHVDLDFRARERGAIQSSRTARREEPDPVFGALDRWLDEILALGLASLVAERARSGRTMAHDLRGRNLERLALELERLTDRIENGEGPTHGGGRAVEEALARVLIALAMAREAYYLDDGVIRTPTLPGRAAS